MIIVFVMILKNKVYILKKTIKKIHKIKTNINQENKKLIIMDN